MVHHATKRAALSAVSAIGKPVDIGFVYPGTSERPQGFGRWTGRDLGITDIEPMLSRAAAANAQGAAIYMRLGPSCRDCHPGIILVDDVDEGRVGQMSKDGFEPRLVIETSPGNLQAWIALSVNDVPYDLAHKAAKALADRYGADPRAVSPMQPGRVPGYTNRKEKYRMAGQFPFVRLIAARPDLIARSGAALLNELTSKMAQGARGGRAAHETPLLAAGLGATPEEEIVTLLEGIQAEQRDRIEREVAAGRRPQRASSKSEIDFATVREALRRGIPRAHVEGWLSRTRSQKHESYAARTVDSAMKWAR